MYWSHWDMARRKNVSLIRSESALKVKPKMKIAYEDIVSYFTDLEKRLRDKVLEITETSFVEWDSMNREEKEGLLQDSMTNMFSADENTFYTAFAQAIDEYYELMHGLGPGISDVVASFIPAMENYTVIIASHLAMLDEKWVITGEHVSMATEILFDLFRNLISWLEGEVEIGPKIAERITQRNRWIVSLQTCETFELGNKGDKWIKKQELIQVYRKQTGVTRGTAYAHFGKWATKMFENTKDGTIAYLRLKEEVKDVK